jgi:hypothetical protein
MPSSRATRRPVQARRGLPLSVVALPASRCRRHRSPETKDQSVSEGQHSQGRLLGITGGYRRGRPARRYSIRRVRLEAFASRTGMARKAVASPLAIPEDDDRVVRPDSLRRVPACTRTVPLSSAGSSPESSPGVFRLPGTPGDSRRLGADRPLIDSSDDLDGEAPLAERGNHHPTVHVGRIRSGMACRTERH